MKCLNRFLVLSALSTVALSTASYVSAQEAEAPKPPEKKAEGHCEKSTGAKTEDVDAKDKADCKSKGGKWNKAAKDGKGGHGHKH